MTHALDVVLIEVAKLPTHEQDALAAILLQEISSEERWSKAFAHSGNALATLASEALAEYDAGNTQSLHRLL